MIVLGIPTIRVDSYIAYMYPEYESTGAGGGRRAGATGD